MERLFRPRVVLPVFVALLVLAILLVPGGDESALQTSMTSYSTSPWGTRAIHDVFAELGWHVSRRRTPFDTRMDTAAAYFIVEPSIDPSATEVSALLGAVRRGATVVTSPDAGSNLADSLGMAAAPFRLQPATHVPLPPADTVSEGLRDAAPDVTFQSYLRPVPKSEDDTAPAFPDSVRMLVRVRFDSGAPLPAVLERTMGRGHALAVSDVRFLDNLQLRDTAGAVLAVRLIEEVAPHARSIIFDEYHHGYGQFTSMPDVIEHALTATAPGRTALQLLVAGLVLLMTIAIRPIAPRPRMVIERRSPFEHVGALSRAYEQVRATRSGTRRLVRGLRRRHPLGTTAMSDAEYLAVVAERAPAAAGDVETLQRALEQPLPAAQWIGIGAAIVHIERTLTL